MNSHGEHLLTATRSQDTWDSEHRTVSLKTHGTISRVTKINENILRHKQSMLCENQTPVESRLKDLEEIISTRRQHDHGRNAKTIFAYEGKEQKSNRHAKISSDSSGMPALVSASSADESGGYLGYMSETESTDETSGAPVEVSNTGPLELLSDIYSLEEMQYLCTEFDSDRGVTVSRSH